MKPNRLYCSLLSIFALLCACNPECENITDHQVVIANGMDRPLMEQEILLKANPPNFLEDRRVFYSRSNTSNRIEFKDEQKNYVKDLGGLVVTLPGDLEAGNVPFFVEDPDCTGDFIRVGGLQLAPLEELYLTGALVTPPIPLVIVPNIPPPPPVNVTNAWIAPYDPNYCIWFVPERDADCNELKELRSYSVADEATIAADPTFLRGSRELLTGCASQPERANTQLNPIRGTIDKVAGKVNIQIDRTSKGLGVENFVGEFISADDLPDTPAWRNKGNLVSCTPGGTAVAENYMLLTSVQTGQQLVLLRLADGHCINE